jgi:hypothetical protein
MTPEVDDNPAFDPVFDVWINPVDAGPGDGQPLHVLAPGDELQPYVERRARHSAESRTRRALEDRGLLARPPVRPDPYKLHLVQRFLSHAGECGLDLPICVVRFVAGPSSTRGQVSVIGGPPYLIVRVTLLDDLPLDDLPRVTWHEAQHAADFKAGILDRFSAEEQELRAEACAVRCADRFVWEPSV